MAEELKTIETVDLSPFKHMVMTIGELPSSFVESMTYYEALAWLDNYLENTIIKTINNNAEASIELQQRFIELRNYVNTYFDNLDVQDEINNKLDEMAEDGTLFNIISEYIQANVAWTFDTVADMKLSTNVIAGSYVQTLGFHTINDGGGAIYKVIDTGTANEMDLIAVNNLIASLIKPSILEPEIYGAYGDGVHNDTTTIQKALDDAATLGRKIELNKNYIVSQIIIKDGTPAVTGAGTIKGNGTVHTGIVFLGTNDNPLTNCTISLNIDMSAGEMMGINGYSVENCVFEGCNIFGGTEKENNTYYLRIVESIKNKFIKNNITAPTGPTGGNHYLLIFSVENPEYLYGGVFDEGHTIHYETNSNVDNIITENKLIGGTHAIVLGWSLRNTVDNNIFKFQSHRGVAMQNACSYNKICNNQFEGILSSGVLMTYGCSYNDIIGNTFIDNLEVSPTAVGQGVICGYIHVMYNHIADNIINSGRLYGIQLSADVVGNVIENNTIGQYYLTGIYLNSDLVPTGYVWSDDFPIPADAIFTRPLTDHTPFTDSDGTPQDYVAFYNCEKNIIQNNTIHRSIIDNNTAAIYITQMGNRVKLQYNVIQNNTYDGVQSGKYYVYLYEQTTNYCIHNSLINNLVNGSEKQIAKFWFSAWRKHFDNLYENDVLDKGMVTVTGTTIDAKYGNYYKIANTAGSTLTNITNTVEGDEILLRLDGYTTIQHASGGNLRLKDGTSVPPQDNNKFIKFINVGTVLVEIFRNF